MISITLKKTIFTLLILMGFTGCTQIPVSDYRNMDISKMTEPNQTVEQETFNVIMEAELPEGFPGPGPVGKVIEKQYPVSRIAVAENKPRGPFFTLFEHIQKNEVAMTTPVEMAVSPDENKQGYRMQSMGFFYEAPAQGNAGKDDQVQVKDYPKMHVVSIGMVGDPNNKSMTRSRSLIEQYLNENQLTAVGKYRIMGYNSPFIPNWKKFYELQIEVEPEP